MKKDLPFDDFVKEQMGNYNPEVPERIWENIIAKRKNTPKGFWLTFSSGKFLLTGLLLLLIAGGSYYFLSTKNSDNDTSEKNIAGTNKTNQILNKEKDGSLNNNDTDKTPANPDLSIKDINKKSTADNFNTSSNKVIDKNTLPGIASVNASESSTNNISNDDNQSKDQNNKSLSTYGRKKSLQQSSLQQQVIPDENNVLDNSSSEVTNSFLQYSAPVNFKSVQNGLNNKNVLNQKNYRFPDCPTIEQDAAGNKKYWEVYAGPDHAFGSYKTFGDTASNNYLQRRKQSTQTTSAYSAGVRYTKVFDNGMSVRAGLNYSQINEKFKYINPSEIRYVTVITTRVIIRSPGDTIYINDTLQYQATGTRAKTTYNRYHNVDIPLVVGYELGNGKFHANINAGVIINVYSWYKGDVLDSLYQPVSITTGKKSSIYQFKTNIGVGFLGSVSLYYKLTDRLHILLEPYFRYNLSPMSKDNLNLQQKYHTAGVRAGLRFDLK